MKNIKEFITEKLKNPRNLAIAALVVGLILGFVIGREVLPVRWTDAAAEHLRADLRLDYLRNLITTYTLNGDKPKAEQLYAELGEQAAPTLKALLENPGFLSTEQITRFTTALGIPLPSISAGSTSQAPLVLQDGTEIKVDGGTDTVPAKKSNSLLWLGFGLLVVLGVGAYLVYRFFFRERRVEAGEPLWDDVRAYRPAQPAVRQPAAVPMRPAAEPAAEPLREQSQQAAKQTGFGNGKQQPVRPNTTKPVAQFMSTYVIGDDRYDESFTFDAPNGEFLGECGVSVSDVVGSGEPKKISAFEIWLFDKNDVQTVTKVLMSRHGFENPATRQRLEIRGEPILAEAGSQFVLETLTLRLEGRIADIKYGERELPPDSYFERSTVELAVYRR